MSLLFFVDESADVNHHFHLGVLADGAQVAAVERGLDAIVSNAFHLGLTSWNAEIHGFEIVGMCGPWEKGRTNIPGLVQVVEECLTLLSTHGIEVITRGVALERFHASQGPKASPHSWLFRNVLERLNERLRARDAYALVVADEQHQYAATMRSDLHFAKTNKTPGYRAQKLDRIVDTVHFVDSKHSRLTQLADLCVFVRRRRQRGPEADPRFEAAMAKFAELIGAAIAPPPGAMDTVWYPAVPAGTT